MRALIHEFGGGDEAERFFHAIVLVVEVHLKVSVCVATEAERRVIGVLVVVEPAKIRAASIGGVDGVIWQGVVALEVSNVRRAVDRTSIDQMADIHCCAFPPLPDWDARAGALFAGPPRVPQTRLENRSRSCVTCLAPIS
jgi:hypothetical protein